ncbi:MAG TPA: hypothetical protein DD435_11460 [Cyanobacteria bacterium UBA8530]|nr:hypothetical protein [Cyanobacteria bacterium UBA8530]
MIDHLKMAAYTLALMATVSGCGVQPQVMLNSNITNSISAKSADNILLNIPSSGGTPIKYTRENILSMLFLLSKQNAALKYSITCNTLEKKMGMVTTRSLNVRASGLDDADYADLKGIVEKISYTKKFPIVTNSPDGGDAGYELLNMSAGATPIAEFRSSILSMLYVLSKQQPTLKYNVTCKTVEEKQGDPITRSLSVHVSGIGDDAAAELKKTVNDIARIQQNPVVTNAVAGIDPAFQLLNASYGASVVRIDRSAILSMLYVLSKQQPTLKYNVTCKTVEEKQGDPITRSLSVRVSGLSDGAEIGELKDLVKKVTQVELYPLVKN